MLVLAVQPAMSSHCTWYQLNPFPRTGVGSIRMTSQDPGGIWGSKFAARSGASRRAAKSMFDRMHTVCAGGGAGGCWIGIGGTVVTGGAKIVVATNVALS